MDNIDKRIKQINKQLHKIEKKNHNILIKLNTVNYKEDAIEASYLEPEPEEWVDHLKYGFLSPGILTATIYNSTEYLKTFGAYMAIPIALLFILAIPCLIIDIALTPVCLFHNFVTMLPGHLLVNAIVKHRKNNWEKKLPEVKKVVNNLKQEKENLLVQKENKIGKEDKKENLLIQKENKIGKEDKKENVVVEKELNQRSKSTTDLENMSGKEIAEHIVKSRKSNSKKEDSEMEM